MNKTKTANYSDFNELMDSYLNKDINKFCELIDRGININCLNNNGKSFVSCILAREDHEDMMDKFLQILLKNNISLKQIGIERSLLTIAIERHDNTSCLEKLLKSNINIDNFGMYRYLIGGKQWCDDPAIFHAIKKEDGRIIELLLKYNVDLNIENQDGETPLLFLLRGGYFVKNRKGAICVMKKLLKNGADPNILGPDGNSVMHYMSSNFHESDIFEILFKNNDNININAKNKFGDTALINAVSMGNHDAVKFLIKNGADLNVRGYKGFSAVMLAAFMNYIRILNSILIQSPDLSIIDNKGNNILHLMAKQIKFDVTEICQKHFNQISKSHPELLNIKNSKGLTPTDLL